MRNVRSLRDTTQLTVEQSDCEVIFSFHLPVLFRELSKKRVHTHCSHESVPTSGRKPTMPGKNPGNLVSNDSRGENWAQRTTYRYYQLKRGSHCRLPPVSFYRRADMIGRCSALLSFVTQFLLGHGSE